MPKAMKKKQRKKRKKSLTKADLTEALRGALGYSRQYNRKILESLLSLMKSEFKKGRGIKIHGFGRFAVKVKKSRAGRNPVTGKSIRIKSRRVLAFRAGGALKSRFNKKTAKSGG